MRIQHVNSGTKAKWKTKGTILQLTVPGVEPIEIDLNEELQDIAVTVDVSLNSGFTALEKGVGNWYVASVKIPARGIRLSADRRNRRRRLRHSGRSSFRRKHEGRYFMPVGYPRYDPGTERKRGKINGFYIFN